jgi:hypothetical protein
VIMLSAVRSSVRKSVRVSVWQCGSGSRGLHRSVPCLHEHGVPKELENNPE